LRPVFFFRIGTFAAPVGFIIPLTLNVGFLQFSRNMLSPICRSGVIHSLRRDPCNNAAAISVAPSLPKWCILLTLVMTGSHTMKNVWLRIHVRNACTVDSLLNHSSQRSQAVLSCLSMCPSPSLHPETTRATQRISAFPFRASSHIPDSGGFFFYSRLWHGSN